MLHIRTKFKPILLLLPVGLGVVLFALLGIVLGAGRPVQAQPPVPDGGDGPAAPVYPLEVMVMEPRVINQDHGLNISVNYEANIVEEGYYTTGHTIWITVTNAAREVKATAQLTTQEMPHWDNEIGYSTFIGDEWVPSKPDIVVGDWVMASSNQGAATFTEVKVGEIMAYIDPENDIVTGTIMAPWISETVITETVDVKCRAYVEATQVFTQVLAMPQDSTEPDGSTVFTCDFGDTMQLSAPWDLEAGQVVAVSYDPLPSPQRSNRVLNYFSVPGPYLQIKKWTEGSVGLNGNIVMNVAYRNAGDENATNVVITDNMVGLSYLGDTLPAAASGSGTGPIVWNVGTVPPDGEWHTFQIFADVTEATVGTNVSNTISIQSAEANQGVASDRTSTWSAAVEDNKSYLSIGKSAWTRDPLPGSNYVYEIDVCNAGLALAVDSSQATLTETLPTGTILADWWSEDGGWTEDGASSTTQLILTRPSIAAHACTKVYVEVTVGSGVAAGAQLCNVASVNAENNQGSAAARMINLCHTVGTPHPNLAIHKELAYGELVPGGYLVYNVRVENTGNVAATNVQIVDTLPTGTSYAGATADADQPLAFNTTPTSQAAGQVTWQVASMPPGYWVEFQVMLNIGSGATAGATLSNMIEVSATAFADVNAWDNSATWDEMVYDVGPNLRVRKTGTWDNWGARTRRLSYQIEVMNVGDQTAYGVMLTDTYDSRLTLDGRVQVYPSPGYVVVHTPAQFQFTVNVGELAPGESLTFKFGAMAPTTPVGKGLQFSNTAQVTVGDFEIDPSDNSTTLMTTTGPDLVLTKTLPITQPIAGDTITYTIMFGNDRASNLWWWDLQGNAWLTDTLPNDVTFVSAQIHDCGATMWCDRAPDTTTTGNKLAWNFGPLEAGTWNILRIVAQIDAGAAEGLSRTNHAKIESTTPAVDVEYDTTNNQDTVSFIIGEPFPVRMYMPLIVNNSMP